MIASVGRTSCAAASCALLLCAGPVWAGPRAWQTAADVGQVGLVAMALGKSVYEGDGQGLRQLAWTEGSTVVATEALKYAIREERPNGRNEQSFPSGHTAFSFAAAGYVQRRYGWEWGLPATVAATLVGVSRVQSRDHHWYDVVAGAALGEGMAWIFTTPRDSKVSFMPWADSQGAGFAYYARF
jgi:hypothetical protein